ncbi:ATP-binding protein [Pseudothauera rhizosphaerae]|uniref:Recombinase RecF n=1 Tax=Pseudothauera rhizosphaerae TaxID=2565932 RepID=A0A4V3WA74_9RHOO|nr:ATP-binding protein [Pseudothauera rhizosphaerae]THF58040.1 recombinase RecF [Pseudothauera rhizosphaerae]
MKLHHIAIHNFLGARTVDLPLAQPVTLLAGANGAGKSSLRDAISLALTADLCRVSKRGEAAALISEGAAAARVFIQTDERDYEVAISKAGKITDSAAGNEPHAALPFVLDPARFARLTDTERRAMLFGLLGIETSHKAIGERMTRRGLAEQKIAAVLPILRAGFGAGEKHAKEMASQARGSWKAITGEAYGDKKADGWALPAIDAPAGADKKAENAELQAKAVEAELAQAQQELGAARQDAATRREAATRIERLREQASMVERIKGRLKTAEENDENCRARLAESDGKSGLIHELAYALDRSLSLTIPFGEMDADQRAVLKTAGSTLDAYTAQHGKPAAPAPADPARADEIRRGLQTAKSGAANARRDLATAEAAAIELAELEKAQQDNAATAPVLDAIEARIAELTERRNNWQADARRYREAAGAAARRAQQIEQATRHHVDVQQWSAIADALSPDGIQAEMIAEALAPLNKLLAEHAALAQWAPVLIGADMSITAAGRAYGLLSESERWRADALLAVAIAALSGLRFVVLDRLDVLDATGREDALYWLSDVAEAGQIDTALVLATLKSAPPAGALPAHIASRWIERGNLIATNEKAREAA